MSEERDEQERSAQTVTPADVLGVFEEVDSPVVTSSDIAERTGCSQDSARQKLEQLHEQGEIERQEYPDRIVYWRPDAADPSPVDPEDPFFMDLPTFSSGRGDLSSSVDELVYGDEA